MISFRRKTAPLALATLALVLTAGTAGAQTFVKADPSNWGIAGYEVKAEGDGSSTVEVISSPEHQATITFKPTGAGLTASIVMARSKETLVMEAKDDKTGVIYLDGKEIASWTRNEDQCEQSSGFDSLAKSPAYITLTKSLQDANLNAPGSSAKAAMAVIIPVLRCGVRLVRWCTKQCNCCTAHYARNPPIGTPEPACCGHCFSWYCGDF